MSYHFCMLRATTSDTRPTGLDTGALPNLLIIGAAKCGTTSLHNYLNAHPEISMSDIKELDFFVGDGAWDQGVDWYKANFDPTSAIRGESSTSYTRGRHTKDTVDRIKSVLSEVKLIYIVRDPIDRIRSDYHQHRTTGVERRSLAEALADPENLYTQASMYGSQLTPYFDHFGADRILVETQERFLSERLACLGRIFRFLGVDDQVDLPEFDRTWERSEGKGWGYALGCRLRERGIRLPRTLRWPAQRLQRSWLLGGASTSARPPEIDEGLRTTLLVCLEPEMAKLRKLTGMSFDEWSL
jgi:Sulfotransferase domain